VVRRDAPLDGPESRDVAAKALGGTDDVAQRPGLTIYLPGNGALLYAAAMMAAGWDGAPDVHAPGFPRNGRWTERWEGLRRAP
jgi:hypothetical protein